METSTTIIGLVITAAIVIPIFVMLRSQSVDKKKLKSIMNYYSPDFQTIEKQNKKVLALDEKNKGFLVIDFNTNPEQVSFVNLNNFSSCKLMPTTEGNSNTIVKIDFEFESKNPSEKQSVTFYDIDRDQLGQVYLYQDHQLAKKWTRILQECILR